MILATRAILIILASIALCFPGSAQEDWGGSPIGPAPMELPGPPQMGDFGFGHAEWHHWYQKAEPDERGVIGPLLKPGTQVSCCDGDCRPVTAKFENGRWLAFIDRGWEPIPDDKIKDSVTAPGGGAHVCATHRYEHSAPHIFCFVRPEGGA